MRPLRINGRTPFAASVYFCKMLNETIKTDVDSPLSRYEGDNDFNVKAGDRMPYFTIDGKRVYAFLREPKFHFLVFSNEEINFEKLAGEYKKDGRSIDYLSFALSPRASEIFGSDKPFCILLRPDNHIAFVSERISTEELKSCSFLKGVLDAEQLNGPGE